VFSALCARKFHDQYATLYTTALPWHSDRVAAFADDLSGKMAALFDAVDECGACYEAMSRRVAALETCALDARVIASHIAAIQASLVRLACFPFFSAND
jgi:hypothetical protein